MGISTDLEEVVKITAQAAQGNWRQKWLCIIVTLYVKNTFKSRQWSVIDEELKAKSIPEYLVSVIPLEEETPQLES